MKIMFAPGFLEQALADGISLEDIEQIKKLMEAKIADGTLFEDSEPVDFEQLQQEDPLVYEALMQNIESLPVEGKATFEMKIQESSNEKPTVH
ncbi:hypothetical protein D3C87_279240 [compost metagenome]